MAADEAFVRVNPGDRTVEVIAGQHHKFMLIPIMENETTWFVEGPLKIGVESRAFGRPGEVLERGASVHVLDGASGEEWLRFDCFDKGPHYHYILQALQHNVVWGYDASANGPMFTWTLNSLRNNLPSMLRQAGADALAAKLEGHVFAESTLGEIATAMHKARERTFPGLDMIEDSINWYNRWKEMHPEFNTVDY